MQTPCSFTSRPLGRTNWTRAKRAGAAAFLLLANIHALAQTFTADGNVFLTNFLNGRAFTNINAIFELVADKQRVRIHTGYSGGRNEEFVFDGTNAYYLIEDAFGTHTKRATPGAVTNASSFPVDAFSISRIVWLALGSSAFFKGMSYAMQAPWQAPNTEDTVRFEVKRLADPPQLPERVTFFGSTNFWNPKSVPPQKLNTDQTQFHDGVTQAEYAAVGFQLLGEMVLPSRFEFKLYSLTPSVDNGGPTILEYYRGTVTNVSDYAAGNFSKPMRRP